MSSIEPFESPGRWWLPGREDIKVVGILRYSTERRVSLDLFGSFAVEADFGPKSVKYASVHGVIDRAPQGSGSCVTLLDALRTKVSFHSAGTQSEHIVVTRTYVGDEFLGSGGREFVNFRVEFSGLADWLHLSGLHVIKPFGAAYNRPNPVSLVLDEANLDFEVDGNMAVSVGAVHLTETSAVSIRPRAPWTHDRVHRDVVEPLRCLIALALNEPNRLDSLTCFLDDAGPWPQCVQFLPERAVLTSRPAGASHRVDEIFSRRDLDADFGAVILRWIALHRRRRSFCSLFFSLIDDRPQYVEVHFLMLLQAVDLYLADPAGPRTLHELLQSLPSLANELTGDRQAFVTRVETVRTVLWAEHDQPEAFARFYLSESIVWLLKLALLTEIGVKPELLARQPDFDHHIQRLRAGRSSDATTGPEHPLSGASS